MVCVIEVKHNTGNGDCERMKHNTSNGECELDKHITLQLSLEWLNEWMETGHMDVLKEAWG